jgi:hypothetical protein
MRTAKMGLLSGAALAALSGPASASIIYLQNFGVAQGAGMTALGADNWSAYYGSSTVPAQTALSGSTGNPANAMISGGPGGPSNGNNVNATTINPSTAYGFVPLLSDYGADQFVVSSNASEYTINTSQYTPTSFSWDAASGYTGDQQRLVIEIGGNWYASTSYDSPPAGVISGTSFQNGSAVYTVPFTTAASSWETLNFTPGSDLTLGSVLTSPLPSGNITQFGVYAYIADNNEGNERTFIDSFEVDATAVPEPASMMLMVCSAGLLTRRRRKVL